MLATRNMKLYLPFERNANDFSGNGNNGTVYGASLVDGGKFGKCYSFDGVDDYIKLDSVLPCGVNSTISLWLTFDELGSGVYYFLGSTDNDSGLRYSGTSKDLLYYCKYPGSPSNYTIIPYIPSPGWHHLVAIRTAARNVDWYVDGNYLGNSDPGLSYDMNLNNIGNRNLPYYYKGKIDSLSYYDRVLSAEDIKRLYMNLHPLNG